jgi:hypothetical protein
VNYFNNSIPFGRFSVIHCTLYSLQNVDINAGILVSMPDLSNFVIFLKDGNFHACPM